MTQTTTPTPEERKDMMAKVRRHIPGECDAMYERIVNVALEVTADREREVRRLRKALELAQKNLSNPMSHGELRGIITSALRDTPTGGGEGKAEQPEGDEAVVALHLLRKSMGAEITQLRTDLATTATARDAAVAALNEANARAQSAERRAERWKKEAMAARAINTVNNTWPEHHQPDADYWRARNESDDGSPPSPCPIVTDRMQGVDCPLCEANEEHRHTLPALTTSGGQKERTLKAEADLATLREAEGAVKMAVAEAAEFGDEHLGRVGNPDEFNPDKYFKGAHGCVERDCFDTGRYYGQWEIAKAVLAILTRTHPDAGKEATCSGSSSDSSRVSSPPSSSPDSANQSSRDGSTPTDRDAVGVVAGWRQKCRLNSSGRKGWCDIFTPCSTMYLDREEWHKHDGMGKALAGPSYLDRASAISALNRASPPPLPVMEDDRSAWGERLGELEASKGNPPNPPHFSYCDPADYQRGYDRFGARRGGEVSQPSAQCQPDPGR